MVASHLPEKMACTLRSFARGEGKWETRQLQGLLRNCEIELELKQGSQRSLRTVIKARDAELWVTY